MSGKFLTLITDKSRSIEIVPPPRSLLEELRLMAVIIPLFLLGFVLPCLALTWDRNDLKTLEDDQFKFSEDFVEKFRKLRGLQFQEEVLYRLPML